MTLSINLNRFEKRVQRYVIRTIFKNPKEYDKPAKVTFVAFSSKLRWCFRFAFGNIDSSFSVQKSWNLTKSFRPNCGNLSFSFWTLQPIKYYLEPYPIDFMMATVSMGTANWALKLPLNYILFIVLNIEYIRYYIISEFFASKWFQVERLKKKLISSLPLKLHKLHYGHFSWKKNSENNFENFEAHIFHCFGTFGAECGFFLGIKLPILRGWDTLPKGRSPKYLWYIASGLWDQYKVRSWGPPSRVQLPLPNQGDGSIDYKWGTIGPGIILYHQKLGLVLTKIRFTNKCWNCLL